jgi:hypothetical protein
MKRTLQIGSLFAIIMLIACGNENNYIVATDFSLLIPDSTQISNGITIDQQQKRSEEFIMTVRENTLNHEIPDAIVFDLNGKSHNLKDQLSNVSLIISTSLTCAWNLTGLLNDFPKANQLIAKPITKKEIVLLILKENNDYFKLQFDENIKDIKSNYSNIFLIDSIQSSKLNILAFSRYYISREQVVLDFEIGTSLSYESLIIELKRNTNANK